MKISPVGATNQKIRTSRIRLDLYSLAVRFVLKELVPHNEIGYSNKVLELIEHMYSVDHAE